MITEQDLQEAIAECKGQRNPNANTCIKLAAFYTIKEHLFPKDNVSPSDLQERYSYDAPPMIEYNGDSEFAQAIEGRAVDEIIPIIDEAMEALKVLNPQFYKSIMRKIEY